MNTLNQAHCEACRADAPQVSDEELPILIKQIPDWNIEVRDGVMQLEKVFCSRTSNLPWPLPTPWVKSLKPKVITRACSPSGAK